MTALLSELQSVNEKPRPSRAERVETAAVVSEEQATVVRVLEVTLGTGAMLSLTGCI